ETYDESRGDLANGEAWVVNGGMRAAVREEDQRQRAANEQRERNRNCRRNNSVHQQPIELNDIGAAPDEQSCQAPRRQDLPPTAASRLQNKSDETKGAKQQK